MMARSCTTCKKTEPQVKLKNCAKCSSTPYCGRDCQKADWKSHKKTCGKQPGGASGASFGDPNSAPSAGASLNPPQGLKGPVTKPFTRLDNGTWLHDRPETDVYTLLVDAYRMRAEDDYKIDGEAAEGSIYGGAADGLQGFRRFLNKTAKKPGLLPPWWDDEKRGACEAFGMGGDGWADLSCAVEKSDVIEHYGDSRFPMQLRMFAEAVYGSGPGGANGAPMRKALAGMESGAHGPEALMSTIDHNTLNFSHLRV